CVILSATTQSRTASAGQISGELKKWHKITLTFDGPETNETADPNPFLYYRLNATFTHQESGKSYCVPGYYVADGDAANTSADSGNKWCVHFAPDATGTWKYRISFRKGHNIAVTEDENAGQSAGFMDGRTGTFDIEPTDKTGRDFRSKGILKYVGKHHLRFAETGEYFLKFGADAPENFLAYKDFDGDFKTDGQKDNFIKDWGPHIKDWKPGDPAWQGGKGKGIIGAVNYLASKGMNVFSFLTMNIGGDDRNVFPYTTYDERLRLDVSRLAQWEIVFEHGTKLGMYLHFKTLENENQLLLDNGDLGPQRKLYYRELIARFGHHLALNWNLGEEINKATHEQKVAWANYFWTQDPYQHHIVIHNMNIPHYDLLGDASKLTGFSLQTNKPDFSQVHRRTRDYIDRSAAAGKPWVVACDEPGDATHGLITDAEDPTRDNARKNALWGNLMAGGAGVEWYFGYKHPHSDLTCQDWRTREKVWDQCRIALEFFRKYEIPFWDMKCEDEMTENTDDYVFCKPGEIYLIYLKHGGKVNLNVLVGNFTYGWFNPRTGDGLLKTGSLSANQKAEVTAPDMNDWLLVIRGSGKLELASKNMNAPAHNKDSFDRTKTTIFEEVDGQVAVEAEHFAVQTETEKRQWYITTTDRTPDVSPDGDENHADSASGGAYLEILPDTRRTHDNKLIQGDNFSNEPGKMAVLVYPVHFNTPGRYYVWVRAYSTGSEDNGLHAGLDGVWPESGQRLQWCEGKRSWRWESKQRTQKEHCGEPYKIYLDIEQPGLHTIEFSMREDGFEFDKWLMTTNRDFTRPAGKGPAERHHKKT
ncbi:MAG: DUF5060 domain-containing protein, partial [Sedimentisphaerales bacterium]|nr:DUF5060 domain-containing protein [Sedimentisphaerales bacterium]